MSVCRGWVASRSWYCSMLSLSKDHSGRPGGGGRTRVSHTLPGTSSRGAYQVKSSGAGGRRAQEEWDTPLSHLCPLNPGWQSQLKEPHSPRHVPWTPQDGPPAVRHTPSVRLQPGELSMLSAGPPRSYTCPRKELRAD